MASPLLQAQGGITMNLTPEIVYRAIAANPYGEPQTRRLWSDVDPSLPDQPILVYGPPSTSGTRDSLKELVLEVGCDANPAMAALEEATRKTPRSDLHRSAFGRRSMSIRANRTT